MQIQTEGIVLRATKYAESDLILNVLTKKFGKIGVYAKNARRLKSPLMSSTQLFSYSDMQITTFDGRYRLLNADLINNHFKISSSVEKTYLGYYFLQFTEKVSMEEYTNLKLFELLQQMLSILQNEDNILLQKVVFDIKLINIFGYKPTVSRCAVCNRTESLGNSFKVEEGGRICDSCAKNFSGIKLDSTSFRLIDFILKKSLDEIFRINVSEVILKEVDRVLNKYVDYHFENLGLSTRDFLIIN